MKVVKIKSTPEQLAEIVKSEMEQLQMEFDRDVALLKSKLDRDVAGLEKKYEFIEVHTGSNSPDVLPESNKQKGTRQKLDENHIFVRLWNADKTIAEIRQETGYNAGYVYVIKGRAIKYGLIKERT